MAGCNEENCLCIHKECANHGKCCECVKCHREIQGNVPYCLQLMLKKQQEEQK